MVEVIFDFEQAIINIQCDINQKMNDIINKFLFKINKEDNLQDNFIYLYNGKLITDKELTLDEQANNDDKNRKKMNIMVIKNNTEIYDIKIVIKIEVIFIFEEEEIIIQCDINDKIRDIINKFLFKINKEDNFDYIYNGEIITENELTFNEQVNNYDKNRKKIKILVVKKNDEMKEFKNIKSKEIICPVCKENTLIEFNKFKINFYGCKGNHFLNNALLYLFDDIQKINLNRIICDICNKNNKGNTYNNYFYICSTCKKNICPLCKANHDKEHNIINYDDKNYICINHNETFTKYCQTCRENLCFNCEKTHKGHIIFNFENLLINKDELLYMNEQLKNVIDKFKYKINEIKEIFNKMVNILDIYYKINNDTIKYFNLNQRNYYNLRNLNYLKDYNKKLIKDLDNIIKSEKISEIFEFAIDNFYNELGGKYIGEIKNKLKEGKGILYYNKDNKNKRLKYDGEFKNDEPNGKGIMYWINGDRYEGNWKNGIMEGKGTKYFFDGSSYVGDFVKGSFEGFGIYYWSNGSRYEGNWKKGIMEGKGIIYHKDGRIESGSWINGKLNGK